MKSECTGFLPVIAGVSRARWARSALHASILALNVAALGCSSSETSTSTHTGSGTTGSGTGNTTGGKGGSSSTTGGNTTGTGAGGSTGSGGSGTTGGNTTGGNTTGAGGAGGSTGTTGGNTTGTGGATTGTTTTTGTGGATTGTTTTGTGGTTTGTTTTTGTGGATTGTTTTTGTGGATGGTGGTGGSAGKGGGSVDAGSPDSGGPGGCNLNTGYLGDDQCILPPPPDKGFQVHLGPTDYKNPEAQYLLQPGQEITNDIQAAPSPNTAKQFFFYRQYRMRPTAHHVIVNAANGSTGTDVGRRIGTANRSEDYPVGGVIAPEDKNIGIPIEPNTPISVSFHAINTNMKPQLREVWINFWYRDPAEVTQPAVEWFEMGNVTFAIPPHTKTQIGPNTCTVSGNGRLLWTYGHRHANNTRFIMTRIRGTKRDVFYDAYDWEHPLLLEFNTITTNRAPDPTNMVEGGWNGILDLMTGDKIEWTCDVNNTTDGTLRFTNNTYTGEMCIVDAEAVGSTCN